MATRMESFIQIEADATASRIIAERIRMKLEPPAMASWMMGYVKPHLQGKIQEAFVSESSPTGREWEPLAPTTIADRERQGYSAGPIQYRSGDLYDYMTNSGGDLTAMLTGTTLTYPSKTIPAGNLKYKVGSAAYGNRRTGAPARPILGLTIQDGEAIMMGLFEFVVGVKL